MYVLTVRGMRVVVVVVVRGGRQVGRRGRGARGAAVRRSAWSRARASSLSAIRVALATRASALKQYNASAGQYKHANDISILTLCNLCTPDSFSFSLSKTSGHYKSTWFATTIKSELFDLFYVDTRVGRSGICNVIYAMLEVYITGRSVVHVVCGGVLVGGRCGEYSGA